ncbi:MAG: hypothetical protein JRE16_00530 [Deltaproteobacteria bacterium]|jgi:methyltransferase|nr:hypothetical protein [Deltaproteobacteria bacterium]
MMSAFWVFCFYFFERLFEILLAKRNWRILQNLGGKQYASQNYRTIVVLHVLFWGSLLSESWPWWIPLDLLTISCLFSLALLMVVRYWCILSLGPYWNTRIIVVPGQARIKRGPYRWLRHPNYLVVSLEFVLIPLLMRAPWTLFLFSLANLIVLRQRITLEEKALTEHSGTSLHGNSS